MSGIIIPTGEKPIINSRIKALNENYIQQKAAYDHLVKTESLNKLFIFNKYVLNVEENKKKLGLFHKELCEFVTDDMTRKKLLLLPRAHLKALRTSSTQVLTIDGFKKYGELRVGDKIIGGDGNPVKVIEVHPKSKMELYKVITNDGREVTCNKEHLFKVRICANNKKWEIRSLEWILKRYSKERLDKRRGKVYFEHSVQLKPISVAFKERKLPIDPYTLGMWLGDGHSAGARITSADPEVFNYSSYKWHKLSSKYGYGTYGLQKELRLNDLKNNKHIPDLYLISSLEQRLELLRGLMDTDGTCHRQGGIAYFSNTNYKLIQDVISLVRSLGGVAMPCKVNQKVDGKPYDAWTVSVKLPNNLNPFNLKRKFEQFKGLKRELVINIVDIQKVEDDVANCITVEGSDGMFIANNYFPTHNSTLITIGYSVWRIIQNQNVRGLILNATWQMAVDFATEVKRHLKENPNLHEYFGDVTQDAPEWSQDRFTLQRSDRNIKGPTLWAAGIDSNLVGSHPDFIIMDDVVSRDNIGNREQIEKVILRYKDALDLLEPGGQLIIIGTKWVDGDLYDWIMDKSSTTFRNFDIMVKRAYTGDLKSGDNFEALWPEKFNRLELLSRQREKGWYEFSAQYLNEVIPAEDADFKKEWFQYYDIQEMRGKEMRIIGCIDPAISLAKDADNTAMGIVGVDKFTNIFIKDMVRKHLRPNEIIDWIFRLDEMWHPNMWLIETIAYQKALAYSLREEMQKRRRYLPLTEVNYHDRTKDQRIRGLQPLYMSKKIWHPKNHPVTPYLEEELLRFPRGRRDDLIDMFSMTLDYLTPPRPKEKRLHHQYLY